MYHVAIPSPHRFVAERGDSGQMTLVDNIDIKYGLKMPVAKSNQTKADELAGIKPKQDERVAEKKFNRIKTTANMGAPTKTLKLVLLRFIEFRLLFLGFTRLCFTLLHISIIMFMALVFV